MTRRRNPARTRHKRVNLLRDCVLERWAVSGRFIPRFGPGPRMLSAVVQYSLGLGISSQAQSDGMSLLSRIHRDHQS
jgi:hypothetical protein